MKDSRTFSDYFTKFGKYFISAALLWFLYDIVAYSSILFGPSSIANSVGIHNGAIWQLIMEFGFTIPGGILAILTIDKVGRKSMQIIGFIGMALALLAFSILRTHVLPIIALIMFGMFNFINQAGPGSISATGILGIELAPTKIRGLVQSITVAAGRIGAALTSFVFPYLFVDYGEKFAVAFLSSVAFVAALLTLLGIPETAKKPLEISSMEEQMEINVHEPSIIN